MTDLILTGLGVIRGTDGLVPLEACSDGRFRVGGDGVRLGVVAPPQVPVHRSEIYAQIREANRRAEPKPTS